MVFAGYLMAMFMKPNQKKKEKSRINAIKTENKP